MILGKLTHLDLRQQWQDEARNFTPWLSSEEGLSILGETLGMELELEDTEVYVGNYRADIVAKDTPSNDYVVIENQLSSTDHDHIGKLLTYAASFGAKTIVWIAKKIREEHRQALDWFNEITVQNVDFFGIEMELLQIADSPYAPNLKIVSKPNEWTRSIRAEKQKLTKGDTLKVEFWTSFNDYLQNNQVNINRRKPGAQHWYDIAVGRGGVHFALLLRTNKRDIACEVNMHDENAKRMYNYLFADKDDIERNIGNSLEWKELPEGKSSRIILRESMDPSDKSKWDEIFSWYVDTVSRYRKAFVPRIKRFKA
ncbi:MAG: hypothetical protein SCARUB_05002 [Candidatus Scalindua rubra]|uniref:DUF4268 domain-containing protein n=1 Tax=Candidatus Scalindua rubra TaxID=1872076 RepID=A0A1E3X4J6_9BACT|nr:MAG: hypothetical protein SCARUB_05002 [Candidatus Scalindua rubra]